MKALISWFLLAACVLSLAADVWPAAAAIDVPGGPVLRTPSKERVQPRRKRRKKRPRRPALRPLGLPACTGTSVITATDEVGNPIFPKSITPVTTESFLFTDSVTPIFQAPRVALRVLVLGEDPPMFTVAPIGLGALVLEPGNGTVVGAADGALVRCGFLSGADCDVVRDLDRPILDLTAAGDGFFAVVTTDGNGAIVPRLVSADGAEEIAIVTPSELAGVSGRTVAVRDDRLYMSGFHLRERLSVVVSLPLGGGEIRREINFTGADAPGSMTFLGPDLVLATRAKVPQLGPSPDQPSESSRLLRVRLDASGAAISADDVFMDATVGFVNAIDLEALDGQLFVVDSQLQSSAQTISPVPGRLLRVCP